MEINYKVTKNFTSINELLQNDLKISSRLLFKLIKYKKHSSYNKYQI